MSALTDRKADAKALRDERAAKQDGLNAESLPIGPGLGDVTIGAPPTPPPTNGDEQQYPDDLRATYHKCLPQTYGFADKTAFAAFRKALGPADGSTAGTMDFMPVPPGLGRRLNGPQGAFAESLVGSDSRRFLVPVPPKYDSAEYAVELIELYWASLLRDVPFTAYETNAIASRAVAELNSAPVSAAYEGPRDVGGTVTPKVLFRGSLVGETLGPYVSQFLLQPTALGALPIPQMYATYAPGVDYLTDVGSWNAVQSGKPMPPNVPSGGRGVLHDGRGFGAYTHVDELYQTYLIAYLVLSAAQQRTNAIYNPSGPYGANGMLRAYEQPFGTFGGPDISATLAAVAREALNAVWYQKWIVHLRHRPESGGGMVERALTSDPLLKLPDTGLHPLIFASPAVAASASTFGSHLLAQAFPEGSPAHPAYPTGHGTVAGACITVLKYFFDGSAPAALLDPNGNVLEPLADGSGTSAYTGADANQMTIDGELHKLASNVSFGHGIHAGIHWRSDTTASIALGEAVALRYLADQAKTYSEHPHVTIRRINGDPWIVPS